MNMKISRSRSCASPVRRYSCQIASTSRLAGVLPARCSDCLHSPALCLEGTGEGTARRRSPAESRLSARTALDFASAQKSPASANVSPAARPRRRAARAAEHVGTRAATGGNSDGQTPALSATPDAGPEEGARPARNAVSSPRIGSSIRGRRRSHLQTANARRPREWTARAVFREKTHDELAVLHHPQIRSASSSRRRPDDSPREPRAIDLTHGGPPAEVLDQMARADEINTRLRLSGREIALRARAPTAARCRSSCATTPGGSCAPCPLSEAIELADRRPTRRLAMSTGSVSSSGPRRSRSPASPRGWTRPRSSRRCSKPNGSRSSTSPTSRKSSRASRASCRRSRVEPAARSPSRLENSASPRCSKASRASARANRRA